MPVNINCKQYDNFGNCNKKPKKFFGLFKQTCVEIPYHRTGYFKNNSGNCDIAERIYSIGSPPVPSLCKNKNIEYNDIIPSYKKIIDELNTDKRFSGDEINPTTWNYKDMYNLIKKKVTDNILDRIDK